MTYVDSSVALAFLLTEPTAPPTTFWRTDLVSSRLLEYEVWNRIHVRGLGRALGGEIRALLSGSN